jgi:hypothetical protein
MIFDAVTKEDVIKSGCLGGIYAPLHVSKIVVWQKTKWADRLRILFGAELHVTQSYAVGDSPDTCDHKLYVGKTLLERKLSGLYWRLRGDA